MNSLFAFYENISVPHADSYLWLLCQLILLQYSNGFNKKNCNENKEMTLYVFFFFIVIFTGFLCFLQDLTQASSFSGFSSLATLLIRHVMEDPVTLRQTMEKVIRSSTVNSSSSNTKELHYLLACLAPAACRSPQLFAEVNFPPLF